MNYTTSEEMSFVAKLGSQVFSSCVKAPRARLLKRYIEACKSRVRWGYLDKRKIVEFAKLQLAEALKGGN